MSNNSKIYAYSVILFESYTQTDFENEFQKRIAFEFGINTVISS